MASEWIDTTIGEQATLQRGIDITKAVQRSGSVPVISSGGVSSFHDTPAASGPGVLLGRKGVVGSVYYVASDYWPHDTTLWVKDFHGNDRRFVYYFFKWLAPRIASMDVGSANPTLNRNHVHPIEIRWPPVSEQHAIAHILGSLDDKFELSRRMNETLEAIARALFKSWCVDLELESGIESGSVRPWRLGKLSELAVVSRNGIDPGLSPAESFDHYSIPAFDSARVPSVELGSSIKSGKLIVPSDAVLLSKLNPDIPRIWMPSIGTERRSICSTEFIVLKASAACSREYLYALVSSSTFLAEFESLVTGATNSHQRVRADDALAIPVLIPDNVSIDRFTSVVAPIFSRIALNRCESLSLTALRDALLPRLVAGELQVQDDVGRFSEPTA